MFTSQSRNDVGGDLVAGDKVDKSRTTVIQLVTSGTAAQELEALYEKLKADGIGDLSHGLFSAKLQ
ncbi:hypothetical protein P0D69_42710, partial [Paraburkholderia sediminicola]